jgi:hypothetical protein
MLLEIPAIFAVLGLFCGYFALGLGRNPYRWFVIGTILGPIGLIVLFLPESPYLNFARNCPSCGRIIRTEGVFCHSGGDREEDCSTDTDNQRVPLDE